MKIALTRTWTQVLQYVSSLPYHYSIGTPHDGESFDFIPICSIPVWCHTTPKQQQSTGLSPRRKLWNSFRVMIPTLNMQFQWNSGIVLSSHARSLGFKSWPGLLLDIFVPDGGGWRKLVWKNETNFASWARRARDAIGRGFSNQLVSPS